MDHTLSQIFDAYDHGQMTRRQLLGCLATLLVCTGGTTRSLAAATPAGSSFEATEINHIALRVTDVARSRDFYAQHLGMKVTRDWADSAFLSCGKNFLALFRGSVPGLDHYCYSVKDYDVGTAEEKLRAAGMAGIRRTSNRIYFDDPDGIVVQLAAETHLPT